MKGNNKDNLLNSSDIICLTEIDKNLQEIKEISNKSLFAFDSEKNITETKTISNLNHKSENDVLFRTNKKELDNKKNNYSEFKFSSDSDFSEIELKLGKNHIEKPKIKNNTENYYLSDIKNNSYLNDKYKNNCNNLSTLVSDPSTSILEIPFAIKNTTRNENKTEISNLQIDQKEKDCVPSFYDPIFYGLTVNFPSSFQKILKKQDVIGFSYSFSKNNNRITITKSLREIFSCPVLNYGDEINNLNIKNSFIFFLDRKSYIQKERNKETKKYKSSLKEKTKYVSNDIVKKYKENLFKNQIQNGNNFVFVESYNDLLVNIKAIVKRLIENKVYIPKVKTFSENTRTEHFGFLMSKIPGISKNVSSAIVNKYTTLKNLFDCNENKNNLIKEIAEILVLNEDKISKRKVGEKCAMTIVNTLFEENPETLLKDIERIYN